MFVHVFLSHIPQLLYFRCNCYGHGIGCDLTQNPYVCTCAPQSYTTGRQCTSCIQGAYRDATKRLSDPNMCQTCNCDPAGTVNGDFKCDMVDIISFFSVLL